MLMEVKGSLVGVTGLERMPNDPVRIAHAPCRGVAKSLGAKIRRVCLLCVLCASVVKAVAVRQSA